MITFKINKKPYSIPTCWSDVTYRQYMDLLHAETITDQIAIFTGISRETLEQAELKNLEAIVVALSFLGVAPDNGFTFSRMVGPYAMPQDITIQSTGQFEALRSLLMKRPDPKNEPEKFADFCLHACAIYCVKVRDGKFDGSKVDEMKQELKNYSCAEVIGTGGFFLYRPLNLSRHTMNRFQMFFQRLKSMIAD
jgi:hypothetical protein